jgi:hypothetical protein
MIPLQIPRKIKPQLADPIKHSVIYSFSDHDMVDRNNDYLLYMFPHSECTYWTNFKFSQYVTNEVWIEVILIDKTGEKQTIGAEAVQKRWHPLYWAMPSIKSVDRSGYYLKVHHEPGITPQMVITLLGFIEIYPIMPTYLLLDEEDQCQFVVEAGSIRQALVKEKGVLIKPVSTY